MLTVSRKLAATISVGFALTLCVSGRMLRWMGVVLVSSWPRLTGRYAGRPTSDGQTEQWSPLLVFHTSICVHMKRESQRIWINLPMISPEYHVPVMYKETNKAELL